MVDLNILLEYTQQLDVLYVEDDKDLIDSTGALLENIFRSVVAKSDGKEGLDEYARYYETNKKYYDLVITDINMPNMNGLQMCDAILKMNSEQSIVITSAHNDAEHLYEAIDLGISGFIVKPLIDVKLMKTLYKVSKVICDQKYIEDYFAQLEDMNLQLDEQNKALQEKNAQLLKSSRILDTLVHKNNDAIQRERALSETIINSDDFNEQIENLKKVDLEELIELHHELDAIVVNCLSQIDSMKSENIALMSQKMSKYSSVLSYYNIFAEVSSAMAMAASTIANANPPQNEEKRYKIFTLVESVMFMFEKWHNDVLAKDLEKVNTLNKSIILNLKEIARLWSV